MTEVTVRYFGPLLDVTGTAEERLDLHLPATLSAVEEEIRRVHPDLGEQQYRIAVDETICEREETIDGAREIALLPAFSGG